MKKTPYLFAISLALLALTGCEDSGITVVKKHTFPYCDSYTVEQVMDSIMQEVTWTIEQDNAGNKTAYANGIIRGKSKSATFGFNVTESTVDLAVFKLNNRSMPMVFSYRYIAGVCSNDYLNSAKEGLSESVEFISNSVNAIADEVKEGYEQNKDQIDEFAKKAKETTGEVIDALSK